MRFILLSISLWIFLLQCHRNGRIWSKHDVLQQMVDNMLLSLFSDKVWFVSHVDLINHVLLLPSNIINVDCAFFY